MAAQSPLRRWKPFFGAFASVDAAIEAADLGLCRDEFRRARGDLVELLCDATDDDQAERLCLVLDELMAESLETLRLVPAMPKVLSSTDLAKAVGALRKHESERVRVLAAGLVRGWRASVEHDLAKVRAAMERLDQLPQPKETMKPPANILEPSPAKKTVTVVGTNRVVVKTTVKIAQPSLPKKTAPVVGSSRVKAADMDASTKVTEQLPKKVSPAVGIAGGGRCSDEKMESTKRKLHEGYQEAEDAKRQHKIQVVEAPEMLRQRQGKMHPIMRERSRARRGSSIVKRSISVTRLHKV